MNLTRTQDLNHSHLFLVRVWPERDNEGRIEWHGRLQHVVSGEAYTFRGCPELLEVLVGMLPVGAEKSRSGTDV